MLANLNMMHARQMILDGNFEVDNLDTVRIIYSTAYPDDKQIVQEAVSRAARRRADVATGIQS